MPEAATKLLWYPGHEVLLRDVVRAENCHVYTADGRRYVDLESGVWCTSVGHGNRRVLDALAHQSAQVAHTGYNYSCAVVEQAAADVLELLGMQGGACVFLCSGSEAVEYGMRVARMVASPPRFLTMADSYFGAYGSAQRRSPEEWCVHDWLAAGECAHEGDCGEACEHGRSIPFGELGGFLFEPGSSSGFVRFPPAKLVRGLARTFQERGGLVAVNEVTTGVGRTGEWFGYLHYGIRPDIVALGKGIGNGYPVSVAAFSPRVVERLAGRPVPYAQSHQDDPAGAAVVREVIRVIQDERLVDRGRTVGARLVAGLEEVRGRTGKIREVRARGLMIAVELEDTEGTPRTIHAHRELVQRGFLVCRRAGTPVMRIDPAMTVGLRDVEDFLVAFGDVLSRE